MAAPSRGSEPRAYRPTWAWTPEGLAHRPVITVDGDGFLVPHRGEPVEDRAGLLIPGMINAHTHLELGPVAFPPQPGLLPWVGMMRAGTAATAAHAGTNALAAIKAGTAALGEISNTGQSTPVLRAANLPARAWYEVFGIDDPSVPPGAVTPHAPHTTHPAVIRAAAATGEPWSIHFDEDPEESKFLHRKGAWLPFMARMGRDLAGFAFPHTSPARYLAALGVLSPRTLLVHATQTRGDDLDIIAESGARVCLCVRSNRAITGGIPDVVGMLARGIPLAIGTDSLASTVDLVPIAEAVALRREFPAVPLATWLGALTDGGADALDLPLGRLRAGSAPGLLLIEVTGDDPLDALLSGTPWRRRWVSCPQV